MNETLQYLKDEISPRLLKMAEQLGQLVIGQERHEVKIKGHGRRLDDLDCKEHQKEFAAQKERINKLENRAINGHKQDEECQKKNNEIPEMWVAIKKNEDINKTQEERRKITEKRIWTIITAVLAVAIAAIFKEHWSW